MQNHSAEIIEIKNDSNTSNDMKTQNSITEKDANYEDLPFGHVEIQSAMRQTYDGVIAFITTRPFKIFHDELYKLPPKDRPAFIARVLFDPKELKRRGIDVPEGILIQRSAFGDRRPTLFVVKKFMPKKYHAVWENMNITFDNEYTDNNVSRDPETSWRAPLPVALQNTLLASELDLESVPTEYGIKIGIFDEKHKSDLELAS